MLDWILAARHGAELHGPAQGPPKGRSRWAEARPGTVARGCYPKSIDRIRVSGREVPQCMTRPCVGEAVGDAGVTAAVPWSGWREGA